MRVNAAFWTSKDPGNRCRHKDKPGFAGRIKPIDSLVDDQPVLDTHLWKLINWLSDYYCIPLGVAARVALPANLSTRYKPPKTDNGQGHWFNFRIAGPG